MNARNPVFPGPHLVCPANICHSAALSTVCSEKDKDLAFNDTVMTPSRQGEPCSLLLYQQPRHQAPWALLIGPVPSWALPRPHKLQAPHRRGVPLQARAGFLGPLWAWGLSSPNPTPPWFLGETSVAEATFIR